ncbi:MAG: tetratricopeptide repeat protein [Elusimicrobia bacterium]|nr:tetratricopeptide repeat protein [Elusimicrobiota bacterium]
MNKFLGLIIAALIALTALPSAAQTLAEASKAYNEKQYEKALTLLETLARQEPDNAQVFLLMGHTARRLERWAAAIAAFERSAALEPDSVASHISLGFLNEKIKNPEKAKAAWNKVLDLAQNEKTKELARKHLNNLP